MLLVELPLADIFCSICVLVNAPAMRFVIDPVSLVVVTVSVDESAEAASLVIGPVALILAASCLDQCASTLSFTSFISLSMIHSPILK